MNLLINELSFVAQAINRAEANELMENMIDVIQTLKSIQGEDPIRTSGKLWDKEIVQGFTVYQWMNEAQMDKKRWFMNAVRKGPYLETLLDEHLAYHECVFDDEDVTSTSLAGAVCFGGILSSLQKCGRFNERTLRLKYREEAVDFEEIDILNAFDHTSATSIIESLRRDLSEVNTWKSFWDKRLFLFPEIVFCDCVEKQISGLNFIQAIRTVKNHLTKMNDYCRKVKHEKIVPDYNQMGIDTSGESNSTLERFGYQRRFTCPDGKERIFEWHSKQRGQNLRIYFFPPNDNSEYFIVGYIGTHLDTCKYH